MNAYRRPVGALLAGLCLAGCAGSVHPRRDAGLLSSCRARTEQEFNRQNRDLLSFRDNTDTPFSTSFDSGITSAGLSRRFARDQLMSSCVDSDGVNIKNAAGAPSADGNAPSFSRDVNRVPTENGP